MEALGYCRVSADRAEGRSVAEQADAIRELCTREGWHLVDTIADKRGASRRSKGHRVGWDQVRERIESGDVDVLVTWEASRAQRDLAAYAELRELCEAHGVLWHYGGRTHDLANGSDRFTTGIQPLVAEREADATSDRVRRAVAANAEAGRPHGRRLYGFRRVRDDAGRTVGQVEEPAEATVVRRIFAEFLDGLGIRTIARGLDDDGHTTGTGAEWKGPQVARVLRNPAYAGRRVHQGEVIGGAGWEPIVEPDIFDRAAAKMAAREALGYRNRGVSRLLSGVGRCGVCGGKVAAGHDRNGRKTYQCRLGFCVARDLRKLDLYVTGRLLERLSGPDVDLSGDVPAETVEAQRRVEVLRGRLDEAADQFAAGDLSGVMLARVEARLLGEIAEAEREARAALMPVAIDVDGDDLDGWWDGLDAGQRREVVGAVIAAVIIDKTKKGSRTFDPASIRIAWR